MRLNSGWGKGDFDILSTDSCEKCVKFDTQMIWIFPYIKKITNCEFDKFKKSILNLKLVMANEIGIFGAFYLLKIVPNNK